MEAWGLVSGLLKIKVSMSGKEKAASEEAA